MAKYVPKGIGLGGRRAGSGRKPFVPTEGERKQVRALAGCGLPLTQIATLTRDGISVDTLNKYFADDIQRGKAEANTRVGRALLLKALDGDTVLLKFWAVCHMGWRERQQDIAVSGSGITITLSDRDADL